MKLNVLNKKVKGVTLLEAMIGMMVGLIVFASAGKIYEVITGQVFTMRNNSDKIEQFLRLNMVMEHDFFKAEKIVKEDEIKLKVKFQKDSLNYFFGEKFVVRQVNEVSDTFFVKPNELLMNEEAGMKERLVNKISFSGEIEKEKEDFVFKKKYPAEVLINSLSDGND